MPPHDMGLWTCNSKLSLGRLIHSLYTSSARSPKSGPLSDWSKTKEPLEPCIDWLQTTNLTSDAI